MTTAERARAMRAEGLAFPEISKKLGVGLQHCYRIAGDVLPASRVLPTARTIVRNFAYNGGCSTQSGMMPISLPRIVALHGAVAA